MTKKFQDDVNKEILDMPDSEVIALNIITERVVRRMDRTAKLTMIEENMIHVSILMAWREMLRYYTQEK